MSNLKKTLLFLVLIFLLPDLALSSDDPKDGETTGITKSSTGRGIPFGSSSDKAFLPWLKPAVDTEYGYSQEKPIEIGGYLEGRGNDWSAQYFSSLLGPNGEPTSFERVKSCCAFRVSNSKIVEAGVDVGFLDQFKITIEGQQPAYIYVTLYTEGKIFVPKGFTARGKQPNFSSKPTP